jgi:hypothetical protein
MRSSCQAARVPQVHHEQLISNPRVSSTCSNTTQTLLPACARVSRPELTNSLFMGFGTPVHSCRNISAENAGERELGGEGTPKAN